MYIPVHTEERDRAVFLAVQLLRETEWLKDILAAIPIASLKDVCPLDSILTENMTEPDKEKMRYYEEYYNASHKLPHAIIIDETKQLRDGYISYLLARKYKLKPDLYEAFSNQPLKKLVIGTHVKFCFFSLDLLIRPFLEIFFRLIQNMDWILCVWKKLIM